MSKTEDTLRAEIDRLTRDNQRLTAALRLNEDALSKADDLLHNSSPAQEAFNPYAYEVTEEEAEETTKIVLLAGEAVRELDELLERPHEDSAPLRLTIEGKERVVWPVLLYWGRGQPVYGCLCTIWPDPEWMVDLREECGTVHQVPLAEVSRQLASAENAIPPSVE